MDGLCAAGATVEAVCLLKNMVLSRGANNTRFSVLKITENIVERIYGIANFSIGLAKESSRK
jgi:hypothetical protein